MTIALPVGAATGVIPPAIVTHLHLLAMVNTRIARLKGETDLIRLCDMGCGDGTFLAYLATALPLLNPGTRFEFYGVEVGDSGVQAGGFFARTRELLGQRHPGTDWSDRLKLIGSSDPWPFEDGFLHVVTSNQVVEHVFGHQHFFDQTYRTLANGGMAFHLFPLRHVFWEGHIRVPLAHRIRQHGLLQSYIRLCAKLGIGAYAAHKRDFGMTLAHYAEEHADYMTFMTNYRTSNEILAFCKEAGLRADFGYTGQFYTTKLRMMLRRAPRYRYGAPSPVCDRLTLPLFKRLASSTLTIEKRQIYSR